MPGLTASPQDCQTLEELVARFLHEPYRSEEPRKDEKEARLRALPWLVQHCVAIHYARITHAADLLKHGASPESRQLADRLAHVSSSVRLLEKDALRLRRRLIEPLAGATEEVPPETESALAAAKQQKLVLEAKLKEFRTIDSHCLAPKAADVETLIVSVAGCLENPVTKTVLAGRKIKVRYFLSEVFEATLIEIFNTRPDRIVKFMRPASKGQLLRDARKLAPFIYATHPPKFGDHLTVEDDRQMIQIRFLEYLASQRHSED